MFASKSAVTNGSVRSYGLRKQIECVKNCRNVNKYDMKYNCAAPRIDVDETSYVSCNALSLFPTPDVEKSTNSTFACRRSGRTAWNARQSRHRRFHSPSNTSSISEAMKNYRGMNQITSTRSCLGRHNGLWSHQKLDACE